MNSPLKEPPTMAYPRTLLSIAVSVGGLAMFFILASSFLVSQPIGSTVHEYFYGVDHSRKYDPTTLVNETDDLGKFEAKALVNENADSRTSVVNETANSSKFTSSAVVKETAGSVEDDSTYLVKDPVDADLSKGDSTSLIKKTVDLKKEDSTSIVEDNNNRIKGDTTSLVKGRIDLRKDNSTSLVKKAAVSGCDLYQGQWVYDSSGPLYSNDSCPILTQTQNCQGNGRPDKDYENWRWKPAQCDVPRFDPKKFLELMRGKTLAFVGDSVARNQMESMMCILWQFEVPRSRGNKRMQRYIFQSTSTTIIRIWSSWLVHVTSGATNFAPAGVDKLHLDVPDETFMELVLNYDVLVLSSGHWFAKKSVYMLNNEVVGGQLWKPQNLEQMKINSIEAFGISVETILTAMVTNPNYKGLTIVRTYSPDHYQGGAWDTGGSCTDKVRPASGDELVDNSYTKVMHDKQVGSFERAIKKKTNKSKLVLMDITQAFQYRHDGHPGPYRSPDSNKVTKRGPDGKPPPQDCLHWCMPGPVDIWNELVLEIIRREFENS